MTYQELIKKLENLAASAAEMAARAAERREQQKRELPELIARWEQDPRLGEQTAAMKAILATL